jgi:hypothetical protein
MVDAVVMAMAADYATVARTIVYTQDEGDMRALGAGFATAQVVVQRV